MQLSADEKQALLNSLLKITISDDSLSAILKLEQWKTISLTQPGPESADAEKVETAPVEYTTPAHVFKPNEIWGLFKKILTDLKIAFGVSEKAAQGIISLWYMYGKEHTVEIATGFTSKNGEDGVFVPHFKPEIRKVDVPAKTIDHRSSGYITHVPATTFLATYKPATLGIAGKDIFGKELPATDGKDIKIEISELVTSEQEYTGLTIYRASEDCMLEELGIGKILLTKHKIIKQDISHKTGNIDAWGSITIEGSVQPNFTVKARGDIIVKGGVESAFVQAEGSITVGGGIFGKTSTTEARSGKNITCLFAENAKLHADENILVGDSVINCHVFSKGTIFIKDRRGTTLTSRLVAGDRIEASVLGSPAESPVFVIAGNDPLVWRRLSQLRREKMFIQRLLRKGFFINPRGNPTRHEKHILTQHQKKRRMAAITEKSILRRQQQIARDLSKRAAPPEVCILKKVHPNIQVGIGPYSLYTREAYSAGTFALDVDKQIIVFNKN